MGNVPLKSPQIFCSKTELPEVRFKFLLDMIGQSYDGCFKGHLWRVLKSWYRAGGQNKDYGAGSHTNSTKGLIL